MGAPLQFRAAHGLWQISAPDRREGSVELGYVRQDADGRLPGVPLLFGVFSSAAEAMLAVEGIALVLRFRIGDQSRSSPEWLTAA